MLEQDLAGLLRRASDWLRAPQDSPDILAPQLVAKTGDQLVELARELWVLRETFARSGAPSEAAACVCAHAHEEAVARFVAANETMLRKLEERSHLALNAAELALWELDLTSGERWWSPRARIMMGFANDNELSGDGFLERFDPEDLVKRDAAFRQAIDPNGNGEYRMEFKVPGKGPEGERWLASMGRAIFENGHAVRLLGTLHDITPRKRDEAERDMLIGALGHDLRSPLASIALGVTLMTQHEDPAVAQTASRLVQSAGRMERMIHDLLSFARLRSRGLELHAETFDMGPLCAEVVDEFRQANPQRNFRFDHDRTDTRGTWDRDRIAQVMQNLVSNAVVHGSEERPIFLSLRGNSDRVFFRVANSGSPIPPDLIVHLFEPFRRGTGRGDGLGLGLYIVRKIIDAHRGAIAVSSNASSTEFEVVVPRDQSHASER
ncbi:Sensor histidine kinase [Labilithrix luteola]|uniref:histidine kinase n=2 Tax=Labilithrix luteola TaxID=1391654 RepID=A0A0K1QDK7_9BACT|nr:Sensor histidine kinase [Labilithrix luteola]